MSGRVSLSITLSKRWKNFLDEESERTGLTRSALIAVALDVYRKQNIIADNMGTFEKMIELLKKEKEVTDG